MDPNVILQTSLERGTVSPIEALLLLQQNKPFLPDLFNVAEQLTRRVHKNQVTYVLSKQIHHTNICRAQCSYCSFARRKNDRSAYTKTIDDILEEIEASLPLTQVVIQGGLNPDWGIKEACVLVRAIRESFSGLQVQAFSPAEVHFFARRARKSYRDVLYQLKDAGLASMPGTSAEILNDKIRKKVCPDILRTAEWIDIVKTAHSLGIRTSAYLLFGHVETEIHVCEHLEILRQIQRETRGFTEFVIHCFVPAASPLGRMQGRSQMMDIDEIFRVVAVSRIFLGSLIPNIQFSWILYGLDHAVRSLFAGANDLGPVLPASDSIRASRPGRAEGRGVIEQIERAVLAAGLNPVQRDAEYQPVRHQPRSRRPTLARAH